MANSSFFGTSGTTASVTNTIQTSVDAAAASESATNAVQHSSNRQRTGLHRQQVATHCGPAASSLNRQRPVVSAHTTVDDLRPRHR